MQRLPCLRWIRVAALSLVTLGAFVAVEADPNTGRIALPSWAGASFCYDYPLGFGANAGIDVPIRYKTDTLFKRNGQIKTHSSETFLSARFEYCHELDYSRFLELHGDIGMRRFSKKLFYGGGLFGVGVMRTFYEGTVYEVADNGTVTPATFFGRFYATTALTGLFGWDLQRLANPLPFQVQLKPSLSIQYPYNSFFLPRLSCDLEVLYRLPLENVSVRHIIKVRRQK